MMAKQRPKDVLAQQEKVAAADGLAFIAPIFWMNLPAILAAGSSASSPTALSTR